MVPLEGFVTIEYNVFPRPELQGTSHFASAKHGRSVLSFLLISDSVCPRRLGRGVQ